MTIFLVNAHVFEAASAVNRKKETGIGYSSF